MDDRTKIVIPAPQKYIRGGKIAAPGLYSNVPLSVYHGDLCVGPSMSSSGLRTITTKSPAHYWCRSPFNPDRVEDKDTEALTLGRAAHHLLLGEDDFSTLFIMRPDEYPDRKTGEMKKWNGNATWCRDWLADQDSAGRTVLTPAQIAAIRGMARSLAAHPLIDNGILNGAIEQSIVWRDKETGLWLKVRPDAIPNDSGDFADLKTTPSVRDDDLRRTIAEYGYHQQGALIAAGWMALTGSTVSSFNLVFVEKEPPHCVRVVTLRDDDLARGERLNRLALRTAADCFTKGHWPGPGNDDAEYFGLPTWAQDRIDKQLERAEV